MMRMWTLLFSTRRRVALSVALAAIVAFAWTVPAHAALIVRQVNLVSDIPGMARYTDSQLVNPWGLASSPSGPIWVSDNGTGVSTIYDAAGHKLSLVVTIPPPMGSPPGTTAAPTGVVYHGGSGFEVHNGAKHGPSVFLFATEDGTISGWNPNVAATNAILGVDNSASGAVYKGLALGQTSSGELLYAANFRAGRIDVFNSSFQPVTILGGFTDSHIPSGYAPFNVMNFGGELFVTYAQQDSDKHDDVAGPGHGFVDIYTTTGRLVRRLAAGGPLNSPWGMAVVKNQQGGLTDDLVVGNFGDGHLTQYDIHNGMIDGQIRDRFGHPIVIMGLWGLLYGNGQQAGNVGDLYFAAGINHEADGLFGFLDDEP